MKKLTTMLWFDKEAGEASKFYLSVFKDSKIKNKTIMHDTPSGDVEIIDMEIFGQDFTLMSAGPLFKFNESISFLITCENQEEIDYYWNKLSHVPESEQCGWCKDKYGLSWQVVPSILNKMLQNKEKVGKVTQALLKMKKFDISKLEEVYNE